MRILVAASLVAFLSLAGTAEAGTITAVGAVKALNNVNQLQGVVGNGNFDEGPTSGGVPLNVYSAQGLTWRTGPLTSILPGVTNTGSAYQPNYATYTYFPAPIGGGGTATGHNNMFAGVATFTVTVTQVGLTASSNGTQYLTAWSKQGVMLGQVTWTPSGDSAFVGIDTLGVSIGMIAYGNHNVWAGQPYDIGGSTIISDSWIWAQGTCGLGACDDGNPCTDDSCDSGGNCSHTPNTGGSCDDGNGCTTGDHCVAGTCVGGSPLTCKALDECHVAGVCNPMDGKCSDPPKPDGTACDDKSLCTPTSTCKAGVCTGDNPVMCPPQNSCQDIGMCDPSTGMCSNPVKADGATCDDNNGCTQGDTCQNGMCISGQLVVCMAMDSCHDIGVCDTTTGMCSNPAKADGTLCDDGNPCTPGDTCKAGVCGAGSPDTCPADACHQAGSCDPTTGMCSGTQVPDGTACPGGTCHAGACISGGMGGGGTVMPSQSSGCKCGIVDSESSAPPAAALLALLALGVRRRKTARR